MNSLSFVRVLRIATTVFVLISCGVDGGEVCSGVRLEYRYNRENASLKNVLAQYVQTIDEYIFDSDSVLVSVNRLPGTSWFGPFVSELDLPPGRYIAVAWGNRDGRSFTEQTPVPGVTTLRDLELLFDTPYEPGSDLRNDSERMYYGYRTFSVTGQGISHIPVDMTRAYCELHVAVIWENGDEMPARSSTFGMTVGQVPSSCGSIPVYTDRNGPVQTYVPAIEDYLVCDSRVLHYIPDVHAVDRPVTHGASMRMDVAGLLRGQVISYRYCSGSHPLLGIYIDGSLLANKLLDLNVFFSAMQTDPGHSLKQEYNILLMVNSGKITVGLMLDSSGWEEGGQL
ncbi:MAG: FimB/Mfa2 family fimbrial subunit [Prevotella sp.]|nr:FimB/Mfa2 family fimbrial subunit [Prevotella sp.]